MSKPLRIDAVRQNTPLADPQIVNHMVDSVNAAINHELEFGRGIALVYPLGRYQAHWEAGPGSKQWRAMCDQFKAAGYTIDFMEFESSTRIAWAATTTLLPEHLLENCK